MKILKISSKKRRVRQRRQLQWRRDVRMTICMLDWKQKKVKRSCTDWLAREGKDVQHVRVIKDENGNVMVNSEAVLKRWKEYFEKLMNKESNRNPRTEEAEVVNEEVNCVSREEVKNALRRTEKGKAAGPDELPVEFWKCMEKMGIKFLTRLFDRLLMCELMPEEWRRSVLIPIYKNKGDAQYYGNYRGIIITEVLHIKVKKRRSQDRSRKNAVFQTAKLALLVVTGSKGGTLVSDKLHDQSDHVLIRQKSEAACR